MENSKFSEIKKLLRLSGILLIFGLMVSALIFIMIPTSNSKPILNGLFEEDCLSVPSTLGNKTVVLRIDDIQAYTWRETSIKMIQEAASRNVPVTLGVIPTGLNDDRELVTFLKNRRCQAEFALHGLTHNSENGPEVPEFGSYSKDEAFNKIKEGQKTLQYITSASIVSWIPPLNIQSTGTIEALGELGFTHLSAEGKNKFDYDATTFIYGSNILVSPEDVVATCQKVFEKKSHCIIMLHPQDFATGLDHNEEKYQQYYVGLLDALGQQGVTFARLKDIPL